MGTGRQGLRFFQLFELCACVRNIRFQIVNNLIPSIDLNLLVQRTHVDKSRAHALDLIKKKNHVNGEDSTSKVIVTNYDA